MVKAVWFDSVSGCSRIRRKIPATTMVLECNRADTGVGPSIAEGSQGCSPNCADFPVAAMISPNRGSVMSMLCDKEKICCISQEFKFIANQAMVMISPISPTRL